MKKIIAVFVFFTFFNSCSLFSQTNVSSSDEVTVFRKENPQTAKKEIETSNIITTEKMKNPNKKEEEKNDKTDAIITDQKTRNPKSPK